LAQLASRLGSARLAAATSPKGWLGSLETREPRTYFLALDLTTNFNGENGTLVNNENACPEGDATKRPNGRKKAKQMLSHGGGDSCIETVDHLWEKKKG
jgi:hypothetical protein